MKRLLLVLLSVFAVAIIFAACSSESEPDRKQTEITSSSEEDKNKSALGNIEIIEKEDGTKIARSETGLEVECSGEKLMELYGEYEAVTGKDEEKEKELLSKIQLILDAQMQ